MNKTKSTANAILIALLLATLIGAAAPVAAESESETAEDCPVVAVLLYSPYVSVRPECLPLPSFP